jgi:NADH-quinone oxidoreductase subunit G
MYNYLDEPNGSMKGGDPGIRLIEPGKEHDDSYFHINHQTFKFNKDEWLIVPVYQIYGSEELSSASFAITQRIKEPFLYIIRKMQALSIKDGEDSP